MKKLIGIFVFMLAIGSAAFAQTPTPKKISLARQAVHECIQGEGQIEVEYTVNYNCNLVDGYGDNITVFFYKPVKCPQGAICIIDRILIASATVDCQDNVTDVTCNKL